MTPIQWSVIFYAFILIVSGVWAVNGDNTKQGYFGISTRDCRIFLWIVLIIIGTPIYGGIFWW